MFILNRFVYSFRVSVICHLIVIRTAFLNSRSLDRRYFGSCLVRIWNLRIYKIIFSIHIVLSDINILTVLFYIHHIFIYCTRILVVRISIRLHKWLFWIIIYIICIIFLSGLLMRHHVHVFPLFIWIRWQMFIVSFCDHLLWMNWNAFRWHCLCWLPWSLSRLGFLALWFHI